MSTATKPRSPHGTTHIEPVRQHLRALADAGIGHRTAAHLSGVSKYTIAHIRYRDARTVRGDIAARILALNPAEHTPVDAVGTRRRLKALIAAGYDTEAIARALGEAPGWVQSWLRVRRISPVAAAAIAELYERWSDTVAEDNGVSAVATERARSLARQRRWYPPACWNCEDIDDPAAIPASSRRNHRSEDLWEDSEELLALGLPLDVVAERLQVKRKTLERARERVKARRKAEAAMAGAA